MSVLTTEQAMQLALKAPCDLKTARKWANPAKRDSMYPAIRKRVEAAAKRLGFLQAEQTP
jgi:hypothetical protein